MHPSTLLVALAAAAALALPGGAVAITGGSLDGDAHPSAVAIVADVPGEGRTPVCSGVLVSPTVVLTAGHCVAWLPGAGVDEVVVSTASVLDPLAPGISASFALMPGYGHDSADPRDLAVLVLDAPVTGIAPAVLPGPGALDTAARGALFTNVGYGYSERLVGDGRPTFAYDGARRVSTSPLAALTKSMLRLQGNASATGLGGTCFGDSGGPALVGTSSVVAAVTSAGSQSCAGPSTAYRLDTPAARAFLAGYVTLP